MDSRIYLMLLFFITMTSTQDSNIDRYHIMSDTLHNIKNHINTLKNGLNSFSSASEKDEKRGKVGSICLSEECIESSYVLLRNMDLSIDPCQDFYRFSCGNYIKKSIIPEDSTRITAITPLREISMNYDIIQDMLIYFIKRSIF